MAEVEARARTTLTNCIISTVVVAFELNYLILSQRMSVQQFEDDTKFNTNNAWKIAHDCMSWRAL